MCVVSVGQKRRHRECQMSRLYALCSLSAIAAEIACFASFNAAHAQSSNSNELPPVVVQPPATARVQPAKPKRRTAAATRARPARVAAAPTPNAAAVAAANVTPGAARAALNQAPTGQTATTVDGGVANK